MLTGRWRAGTAIAVTTLAAALVSTGGVPVLASSWSTGSGQEATVPLDPLTHEANWSPGAGVEGDLATRITITPTEPGATEDDRLCTFRLLAAGLLVDDQPMHVFGWQEGSDWWLTFTHVYNPQVHVGPVDTRGSVTSFFEDHWATNLTGSITVPLAGATWTLVGFDLQAWTDSDTEKTHPPFELTVRCPTPVELSLEGSSREALGFTHESMEGGAGASVLTTVQKASAAYGDTVTRSFTTERIDLAVRTFRFTAQSYALGSLELAHPAGTEQWTIENDFSAGFRDGGPGEYTIGLTRASTGSVFHMMVGALVGLDDELV